MSKTLWGWLVHRDSYLALHGFPFPIKLASKNQTKPVSISPYHPTSVRFIPVNSHNNPNMSTCFYHHDILSQFKKGELYKSLNKRTNNMCWVNHLKKHLNTKNHHLKSPKIIRRCPMLSVTIIPFRRLSWSPEPLR